MKYLFLVLILVGCSQDKSDNSNANSNLTKMCVCAANKKNLNFYTFIDDKEPNKSTCRLIHKTERDWTIDLNSDEMNGLRHAKQLEKFKKAPEYESCMKKLMGPFYRVKHGTIELQVEAHEKCSKKVFGKDSIYEDGDECWGF